MSNFEKDKLFLGVFSIAGMISADKFNIFEEFNKTKDKTKNRHFHDNFLPDKEWQDTIKKKQTIKSNDIIEGCKFNIDELKSEIKNKNLYYKEDSQNKKHVNRSISIKNNSIINIRKNIKNVKNPIIIRKYKYHDLHMKKIAKYKKEGLYDKILNQQESVYYPKLDYIYKKIESGPKWEKLSGRGKLFEAQIKQYNSIDSILKVDNERNNFTKIRRKFSNHMIPSLAKNRNSRKTILNKLDSAKYSNAMTKSTSYPSKTNIIKKLYSLSSAQNHGNYNINFNNTIFSFNNKEKTESKKKLILKNPNKTSYKFSKCKSVLEFGKYIDYEKIKKKIEKNQQMFRIKDILNPNYSYIEEEVKAFVNYKGNTSKKRPKNKKIKFEGVNTNELLYDANYTFDKIYGNKMKAVPIFHKMMARPNDINLPSYMKGLYSRMGLYLTSEKTLQMNNYENSKMFKFNGDFTPKNKNKSIIKVYYENEINDDKNKIDKDLENMKNKFKSIRFQIYE